MAKTIFQNGTVVTSTFLNSIYNLLNLGHKHDGVDEDGHADKIDLTAEVTGVLPPGNVGDIDIDGGTTGQLPYTRVSGLPASEAIPIGMIMPYYGTVAPTSNWLLCNGDTIPVAPEYDALRSLCGPDTPNFEGRSIFGYNSANNNFDALGVERNTNSFGGEEQVALIAGEGAPHIHTMGDAYSRDGGTGSNTILGYSPGNTKVNTDGPDSSGAPHNNIPPYGVALFVIKAL